MNVASTASSSRPSGVTSSITSYTDTERSLHRSFAARSAKQKGWNSTCASYHAMRAECARVGVSACTFPQFCGLINGVHSYHFAGSRRRAQWVEPASWPLKSRPADIGSLLAALDRDTFCGW